MELFTKNIILDQEAFQEASGRMERLVEDITSLRSDIEKMLEDLQTGFDSEAGRKFVNACKSHLLTPLEQQQKTIEFTAGVLKQVIGTYEPSFTQFKALNNSIQD